MALTMSLREEEEKFLLTLFENFSSPFILKFTLSNITSAENFHNSTSHAPAFLSQIEEF